MRNKSIEKCNKKKSFIKAKEQILYHTKTITKRNNQAKLYDWKHFDYIKTCEFSPESKEKCYDRPITTSSEKTFFKPATLNKHSSVKLLNYQSDVQLQQLKEKEKSIPVKPQIYNKAKLLKEDTKLTLNPSISKITIMKPTNITPIKVKSKGFRTEWPIAILNDIKQYSATTIPKSSSTIFSSITTKKKANKPILKPQGEENDNAEILLNSSIRESIDLETSMNDDLKIQSERGQNKNNIFDMKNKLIYIKKQMGKAKIERAYQYEDNTKLRNYLNELKEKQKRLEYYSKIRIDGPQTVLL